MELMEVDDHHTVSFNLSEWTRKRVVRMPDVMYRAFAQPLLSELGAESVVFGKQGNYWAAQLSALFHRALARLASDANSADAVERSEPYLNQVMQAARSDDFDGAQQYQEAICALANAMGHRFRFTHASRDCGALRRPASVACPALGSKLTPVCATQQWFTRSTRLRHLRHSTRERQRVLRVCRTGVSATACSPR